MEGAHHYVKAIWRTQANGGRPVSRADSSCHPRGHVVRVWTSRGGATLAYRVLAFPIGSGSTHSHFPRRLETSGCISAMGIRIRVLCVGLDPGDEGQKTTCRGGACKVPTRAHSWPDVL